MIAPHRLAAPTVALLVALAVALPHAAHAQIGGSMDPGVAGGGGLEQVGPAGGSSIDPNPSAGQDQPAAGGDDADKNKALPPPPSLPGSHAQQIPVAPADKSVADMEPNAALFDAINRGDQAGVRDAISRGAALDSRNVLGLTPIELSVDLGRNDISFLLLSMRSSAAAAPAARGPIPVSARGGAKAARGAAAPAEAVAGAPAPASGFLGFGGS